MKKVYLLLLSISLILVSCKSAKYGDLGDGLFADIQTSNGDIIVKLEYEKTPVTVANFVSLAEGKNTFVSEEFKGKRFYDGLTFHRVMKDFMIQGGDPLANGLGNPGYKFMDEFNDSLVHDRKGVLSMANGGPASNGSQFFITHKPTPWLNDVHSIFGEVVVGIPVLDSIANVPVAAKDKPVTEVTMNTIEIIRNGKAAKNFDAVAVMTDYFGKEEERLATLKKEKEAKMALELEARKVLAEEIKTQKMKAKALPSGLRIFSLTDAKGKKPGIGSNVLVNYAGFLEDGTLFDTSMQEVAEKYGNFEQIFRMHRGNMIPSKMYYHPDAGLAAGFREGLLTMKVGDKIRVFVPSHLGYGEQGGGPIPPKADLVFDLEIMSLTQ